MLAADWLRMSSQVGGAGGGDSGGDRHEALTTLSLSLSLSPILNFDILDSIKTSIKT